MRNAMGKAGLAAVIAVTASRAPAAGPQGFDVSVLVAGSSRPEYSSGGTIYVEAIRGRDYAVRITNPLNVRVAVALSVDGLNSIDAQHGDAWSGRKWVLAPYETTVISGWQVSSRDARRFTFTGERHSYGATLGQTSNLGVIEAVFYRERRAEWNERSRGGLDEKRSDGPRDGAAGRMQSPQSHAKESDREESSASSPALSDDYAATGMGGRTRHDVERVYLDLEPQPAASVRLRYEFHAELVKLGVLPERDRVSPLSRREAARGFESYCPETR